MSAHDRVAEGGGHACGTPPPPPPAQVACSAQCWTCQRGDTHYRTEDRRRHVSTSIDHTSIAGADVALQQLWSICTGTWSNWQVHAKNLPRGEVGQALSASPHARRNCSLGQKTRPLLQTLPPSSLFNGFVCGEKQGSGKGPIGKGSLRKLEMGGSAATGPREPGPEDDNRNIRRKLETNPDHGNSRSAVCLHFTCAQSRAGVSALFSEGISASEKDHEVKCKSGSTSARIVFAPKAMCQ